jgi:hypothetical protein
MKTNKPITMKTKYALCGLLSGLLLLAAGTAQTHAGLWNFAATSDGSSVFSGTFTTDDNGFLLSSGIVGTSPYFTRDGIFNNIEGAPTPTSFVVGDNPYAAFNDTLVLFFASPLTPAAPGTVIPLADSSHWFDGYADYIPFTEGSATAVAPVPEPGTALFGMACVGVAALRRRRRA